VFILAACGTRDVPPPEPLDVLNAASVHINDAESFRIEIWQEGAPYFIESDVIDGDLTFDRALMDYVAPDVIQGRIRAQLMGLPFEFSILGRGERQWVNLPAMGWTDTLYFAPGFNPETLIAEDSGFQAALSALEEIEMVGRETLDDGSPVWHVRGVANGPAVSELMVYIITTEDPVLIDAYIHTETSRPIRLEVTIPGTETEEDPDPTKFIVELYDFNEELEITGPTGEEENANAE
jgi:hypothetical protein